MYDVDKQYPVKNTYQINKKTTPLTFALCSICGSTW